MRPLRQVRSDVEQQKAELETVLASKLFARAPSLARLLSYVCERHLEGEAAQIKEYTIAVELFRRSADFNSKEDPIVRVEANRLRARLKEYYRTEGKDHPIQITIPSGQYAPVFSSRRAAETSGAGDDEETGATENGTADHDGARKLRDAAPDGNTQISPNPAPAAESTAVPVPRRAALFTVLVVAGLTLLIAGTVWIYRSVVRRPSTATAQAALAPSAPLLAAPTIPTGPEIRIMAGSTLPRYVDRLGKVWDGDRYYKGGSVFTAAPTALLRAEESHLCRQAREGDFDYEIPLKPGVYELHLHFVEMQFGAEPEEGGETSRLFAVSVNGRPVLEYFDILSDAGGCGVLDERVFTDVSPASDGLLHISFRSDKSKAIVSGLEILPGIAGRIRPIRITTRTSPYLSSDQRLWEPDRFFRGGRSVVRIRPVDVTKDPDLYQSERYGNFSYVIPVARGRYSVSLKFAETYFGLGPTNPPGAGPGMRVFDVFCNGQTLIKELDIAREVGANRALDKVFSGVQPNAQGKIVLSFIPVRNYACVSAIEVVPE